MYGVACVRGTHPATRPHYRAATDPTAAAYHRQPSFMRRVLVLFLACVAAALAVAAPAAGKEGVRARIAISAASLQAAPGTKVEVSWTLSAPPRWTDPARPAANAPRKKFGASGLYVRLDSRTGAAPTIAYGHGPSGRYSATATVPAGGIGGIALGLEGVRIVKGRPPQRADVFFPIETDPFATGATSRDGGATPPLLWIGWGLVVVLALVVGMRRARRRRLDAPAGESRLEAGGSRSPRRASGQRDVNAR